MISYVSLSIADKNLFTTANLILGKHFIQVFLFVFFKILNGFTALETMFFDIWHPIRGLPVCMRELVGLVTKLCERVGSLGQVLHVKGRM